MIITRRSKIARLPRGIREQLNSRLDQGEEGTSLVAWLNSLPEVQSTLASHFDGDRRGGGNRLRRYGMVR